MKLLFASFVLMLSSTAFAHSEGELNGMKIVFAPVPEPAFNNEVLRLEWRVTDLETEE